MIFDNSCDADGIRTGQLDVTDVDNDGSFDDETATATSYFYDKHNPTGYAQILEETATTGASSVRKTYTLGNDVVAQQSSTIESGCPLFLLYDGHGSTRALVDATGQILTAQIFRYDAFGVPLAHYASGVALPPVAPLTSLLYSGERTDPTGLQYLRARYYDPRSGRFTTIDPYRGNLHDPQTLHRYLYCHADPVNGIDPSGMMNLTSQLGTMAGIGGLLGMLMGGIDALLGGDNMWIGAATGAGIGAGMGALAYLAPGVMASSYVLGVNMGLSLGFAADSFQQGKDSQGYFRVITGAMAPLALRSAAIKRLASLGFSRTSTLVRSLWAQIRPRTNAMLMLDDELGGMAGACLSRRMSINSELPPGEYLYAFDADGAGWALPKGSKVTLGGSSMDAKHSSLVPKYGRVRSAGLLRVNSDRTVDVNLDSGHFFRDDPIHFGSAEEKAWLGAISEAFMDLGLAVRYASSGHEALP